MNVSGNSTRAAPAAAASLMRLQAFSVVASRSRKTGAAWTAATFVDIRSPLVGRGAGDDDEFARTAEAVAGVEFREPLTYLVPDRGLLVAT